MIKNLSINISSKNRYTKIIYNIKMRNDNKTFKTDKLTNNI